MTDSHLRIAWFSDLSVGRTESLSTYCTKLLLPELSKKHAIEVFSDEVALLQSATYCGVPVEHYLNAYKRHRERPFDLFFYQLEDSWACRFIRGHIGLVPGIVWAHDLFCNDLGPEACHTSPWEHSIKQFFDSSLGFVDRTKAPHQLWPRAFRETSLCPVVLFSSQWARNEFKQMVSNRLESINGMHFSSVVPVPVSNIDSFKPRSQEMLRIASIAVPGIEGRVHKVFPALRGLGCKWHLTWMVDGHEVQRAYELCNEFGLSEQEVTVVSQRSINTWTEIAGESDVALHLHSGPFGHLAPYIQISLAQGCPVIVAKSGQGEDFPDDAVFGITPGLHESAELRGVLSELIAAYQASPYERVFGSQGMQYAQQNFNVCTIAKRLSDICIEMAPHVSHVMHRWQSIGRRAQKVLLAEVKGLVSACNQEGISAYDTVLMPAIKELGWDNYR